MGWHDGWMGMGGWMFPGFGLIIVILVVVLFVWLINGTRQGGASVEPRPPRDISEDPLEIVKRRYARGEITREEFEQLKRDLGV